MDEKTPLEEMFYNLGKSDARTKKTASDIEQIKTDIGKIFALLSKLTGGK